MSVLLCGVPRGPLSLRHPCRPYLSLPGVKTRSRAHSSASVSVPPPSPSPSPPLRLETGRLARLAEGSCVASSGGTAVLATVCRQAAQQQQGQRQTFLPLTVDFRQKAAAAGRIPTNHLRRELGPSDREVLTSRLIDRAVRPMAAKGVTDEVGVTVNLLSMCSTGEGDPGVLGVNSSALALCLSSLSWGAVGCVRVCLPTSSSKPVINPTRKLRQHSTVDLVVVGTEDGRKESHLLMLDKDER